MVMLGDMLAAARNHAPGVLAWLRASDPELADQIETAALQASLTPTSFIRTAVADFSRFASEEHWATLTSSMRDSDDPATVCLLGMVHWRLTVKGCDAHSHSHANQEERPHAQANRPKA